MNKLLMLGASILCIQGMIAAPLTPEEALARLAGDGSADGPVKAVVLKNVTLRSTIKTDADAPAIYVFNSPDNTLLFVGADDLAEPLLGYTDEPSEGEFPPQLLWWLSQYASTVSQANELAAYAPARLPAIARDNDAPAAQNAQTIYRYIAPMVTTKWNQSAPYNNLCPSVNGTLCYTGCTATATAQVMKYHNYPASGTGTKTYTPNVNNSGSGLCHDVLTLDLSGVHFDWTNMINDYSGSYNSTQANAVATLMKAVGYVAEMNYGTNASGASAYTAIEGLKTYFNYNEAGTFIERSNFSHAKWEKLIYDNLKTVGPVIYCGYDLFSAGHAFVCDGYTQGMFHFNWGWGGLYNGYFKLSALTPAGEGIGGNGSGDYSFNQQACLNVTRPDAPVISVETANFNSIGNLTAGITDNLLTITTDGRYPAALHNLTGASVTVLGGVRIVAEDGTTNYQAWRYAASPLGSSSYFEKVEVYLTSSPLQSLPNGTYKLYIVAKISGESDWQEVAGQPGCADHVLLTKTDEGFTVENVEAPKLDITDFNLETGLYYNTDFRISYTVANNSGTEIQDGIQPIIYTKKSSAPATAAEGPRRALNVSEVNLVAAGAGVFHNLEHGESTPTTHTSAMTTYTAIPSGQVYLGLKSTNSGDIIAEKAVTLNSKPSSSTLSVTSFSYDGDVNNVNAMRLRFKVGLTCTNGYNSTPVRVYIYPTTGVTSLASAITPSVFLAKNQSATEVASGSFPTASVGSSYIAIPYVNNALTSDRVIFKVGSVSGIELVEEDDAEDGVVYVYDRASGLLSLSCAVRMTVVELYTIDGRLASRTGVDSTVATIAVDALPSGVFMVNVVTADGNATARKFVK